MLAREYFAADVKVEFALVNGEQQAPPSLHQERMQQESDRQKQMQENAQQHPMVQSAVEIFGGTIEEIRPIDN